jgi:ABC-type transport system involved in cytochrome bd biosynthesis fused ATPase/permease subunit
MKLSGFLLLLSGWIIVAAAAAPGLLHGRAVAAFILAGLAVEILGLTLFAKSHIPVSEDNG